MESSIPKFGNLQGLKVLCTGSALAGPFGAVLFAENGAEVIHVESTMSLDSIRNLGHIWVQEHRNQRMITLDIPSPEGREVFERMISWCDIWIESSKGGTYDKWGFSDEALWKINSKLVIVHVSGFGQSGEPSYISRASYDHIGQAFSGYVNFNGTVEKPVFAKAYVCDYVTGFQVAWSALAALYRTQKTGTGESIDVAQFEAMARIQGQYAIEGLHEGKEFQRFDTLDPDTAGDALYKCRNGKWVMLVIGGSGPMKRGLQVIGLGDDPDFKGRSVIMKKDPFAEKFVKAMRDFCASHTDLEVEKIMSEAQVPCSRVMLYEDMLKDPHYKARDDIIEYYDPRTGSMVRGFGAFPKFKNNPQQIWCGGGTYGRDNELVLKQFGYDEDDIKRFYEKKVIAKEQK